MLSLRYLPTAGRLTVTIIKARNLRPIDSVYKTPQSADSYVKVTLMCHGRRIKKRKISVRRDSLHPVYNESIAFDVPSDSIEDVSIIVKVINASTSATEKSELFGVCAVGPQYIGTGRDHWLEMIDHPRKYVAQWYALEEHLVPSLKDQDTTSSSNPSVNGATKRQSLTVEAKCETKNSGGIDK